MLVTYSFLPGQALAHRTRRDAVALAAVRISLQGTSVGHNGGKGHVPKMVDGCLPVELSGCARDRFGFFPPPGLMSATRSWPRKGSCSNEVYRKFRIHRRRPR